MSDQALQLNPIRPIRHGINPDCPPEHTMDQAEHGDAIMEDPEPDGGLSEVYGNAYSPRPETDSHSLSSGGWTPDLGEEWRNGCPKSPECASDSIGVAESGSSASQSAAAETTNTDSRDSYSTTDYTNENAFSVCSDSSITESMAASVYFASRSSPETHVSSASARQRTRSSRHHGEQWEPFGLTTVHLSHQFGFRDSTLWCWRCGGWSVGTRRTSRLQDPCGAPTKNGADVVSRVSGGLPPKALHWSSDDISRNPERIQIIKNPYSNRFRPQVFSQVDSPA